MSLIIGLTGSIASGKSTISHMFDELDIPVVDADLIAREVVEPGEESYRQIIDTFGTNILLEDRTINRKKLGSIVFSNEDKRKKLNAIVHPAVRQRMLERRDAYVRKDYKCVVLDIPLLYESNLVHLVDKTIVVYVDKTIQLQRLMERDRSTEHEALQRIRSQMSLEEKIKMADAVIDNNRSQMESYQQLLDILRSWNILS